MLHWSSLTTLTSRTIWMLAALASLTVELTSASAQQSSASAQQTGVKVGIAGHYRVGRWTGVRFQPASAGGELSSISGGSPITSVETRDGDGVEVRYGQVASDGERTWNYAIPGTEAAPLIVRSDDQVLASTRFPTSASPSRGPSLIPLDMPWMVVLGDPLGIQEIGANEILDRDALIAVSQPASAVDLPDSSLGYDGVDMMFLGGSSSDLLAELSESQQQAMVDWITDGGRVFLTLGESSSTLLTAAPWIKTLLPLEQIEMGRLDPSAIETYTSSQSPLVPFEGVILPKDQGRILIMGRTTRRVSVPIAAEYNVGFGRITVVAADLESELFANWPERLDLITQLTGSILVPNQENQARRNRTTAYNDLAGQVRSSLDQFQIKRKFGFSVLSLVLMALIAAIGPLDYLLLNRVFGRPLLGWITFPIVIIGLSAILVYQSRPVVSAEATKSDEILQSFGASEGKAVASPKQVENNRACNRIEIVDIDTSLHVGRSFSLEYLYTHQAALADVQVTESETLAKVSQQTHRMLTVPFGYPGESFGGIQIAIEDSRLPVYDVPFEREATADGGEQIQTSLMGVPLASRSSKGMMTRSHFVPRLSTTQQVARRPGSELVQGGLTNPLPVDLLNGMLIYRNWIYLLPTRFSAGDKIASLDKLRQKNFRWHLSRQQALESSTQSEDWNPSAIDAPDRIAEMLMFHEAVGGTRYTSLRDDPLSFLDLSHTLTDDRCILIGRVADPALEFETTIDGETSEPPGERLTYVRVVLPVIDRRANR